jgi:chromosomal replication initiator protein
VVSNLFSIRFDDSISPSAEVVVSGRDGPVREYFAGPENALLVHLIGSYSTSIEVDQPILMFGPAGVGKTHLLRGFVDRIQTSQPNVRVRLQNGADFCREFSQAHEVGSLSDVRQQLRSLDCLAIDDLHLLAEKPFAQLELLYLLDSLKDRGTNVLLTSRLSPNELPFSSALKSRLRGGLTVPIQLPEPATRSAFVRRFANELDLELPDDVVNRLAEITPASIPELRGLVLQLNQSQIDDQGPIDVDQVSRAIEQRAGSNVPGVREITKKVARYFGLTVAELTGPSRRQTTVLARDTAIFLTRNLRKDSFEQIGTYFGGRDHSTIMHAYKKINKKRDDSLVAAAIVKLVQRLGMQHHNL